MMPLGRLLQFAGLTLLPLAIFLELSQAIRLKDMLVMLVFGVAAFYAGRIMEGYARR